eukprot:2580554-Rhodomonas_salina.1
MSGTNASHGTARNRKGVLFRAPRASAAGPTPKAHDRRGTFRPNSARQPNIKPKLRGYVILTVGYIELRLA